MKTAIFKVTDQDNLYVGVQEIEAPVDSTREDILELYFEKNEPDSDEDYQDMINTNYGITSDELDISNL